MIVRPIRTAADYESALSRLDELMDAIPGSPEADELDVIATLIEKYEEDRFPIEAPTPLAAIRFRMEQDGLTPRAWQGLIPEVPEKGAHRPAARGGNASRAAGPNDLGRSRAW